MLSYEQAVAALSTMPLRAGRIELGRMREFMRRLGLPNGGQPRFIHVAGTNGKGSTTAFVRSLATGQGYRAGGYFSPYVYDLRERWLGPAGMITREDFAKFMSTILPISDEMRKSECGGPTEFEVKTAVGFLHWTATECEIVALEVGLGGLYDSTNIVDPIVSVITSISLDHQAILGHSLTEIAKQKAGIIKPGRPVVVGDLPSEAMAVMESKAKETGSTIYRFGKEFTANMYDSKIEVVTPTRCYSGVRLAMYGPKQAQNAAVALMAMEAAGLLHEAAQVPPSLAATTLPGRFEERSIDGRTVILDGAHNPESARVLAQNLLERFPDENVTLLVAMRDTHDPDPFFAELAGLRAKIVTAPLTFGKCWSPDELARAARGFFSDVAIAKGVADAFQHAANLGRPIVVTGSFYLLSDLIESLTPSEAG